MTSSRPAETQQSRIVLDALFMFTLLEPPKVVSGRRLNSVDDGPRVRMRVWLTAPAYASTGTGTSSPGPDAAVPEVGMAPLPVGEERDHRVVGRDVDLDAAAAQKVLVAAEVHGVGDDEPGNLELNDAARAHHARAQRRVEGRLVPPAEQAGVPKAVR